MIIENKNYDYASNVFEIVYVLILLIGILVMLKSHQLTKPYINIYGSFWFCYLIC